jgi:hypothetical protein
VYVEGDRREDAINWAADETRVHRRTIERDLEKHERYHLGLLAELARAQKLVGGLKRRIPQLTLGERERAAIAYALEDTTAQERRALTRYEIDEIALSQHFLS